jgi:hypothetical protein
MSHAAPTAANNPAEIHLIRGDEVQGPNVGACKRLSQESRDLDAPRARPLCCRFFGREHSRAVAISALSRLATALWFRSLSGSFSRAACWLPGLLTEQCGEVVVDGSDVA